MKIGFIGAGKAGNSLARHFAKHDILISGFYSKTYEHAKQAADYIHSAAFLSLNELVAESDVIFVTTSDGMLQTIWESMKNIAGTKLTGKTICHVSGSISSEIFDNAGTVGAYSCSAHPMQAMSGTDTELSSAFFTIEGMEQGVAVINGLLNKCGNPLAVIDSKCKTTYHAAAAVASNLMVGLTQMAAELLEECGFNQETAVNMLGPLMRTNLDSILNKGPVKALTGPIERGDLQTVKSHLTTLKGRHKEIYKLLSLQVLDVAVERHPDFNYQNLKDELEEQKS